MSRKPRIALLGMGGTIASAGVSPTDVLDYPELGTRLSAHEVVARVPQVHDVAELAVHNLREVVSTALTVSDWFALRASVRQAFDEGAEGVVVLHGTGTLEESAYFLHLTLDTDRPVVIVGAQRPLTTIGSDAPMNLLSAVRCATSPGAVGAGVLVVLNDEIHSARHVEKVANRRLNAFESPGHGPVGYVDGDQVTWNHTVATQHTATSELRTVVGPGDLRVDIVYSYVGADDVPIRALLDAGARGLISAGFAPGSPSPLQRTALLEAAREGIVVVQSSRAARDRVPPRAVLREAGFVAAQDLNPQKSRVLLLLGLTAGITDPTALGDLFATH